MRVVLGGQGGHVAAGGDLGEELLELAGRLDGGPARRRVSLELDADSIRAWANWSVPRLGDVVEVGGAEAVLAEHLLVLGGEDDLQQVARTGLVLRRRRDADVRAAGEHRSRLAVVAPAARRRRGRRSSGCPCRPDFSRSPIDQCAQPGAMIVAAARLVLPVTLSGFLASSFTTSESLMYSHGDWSFAVFGAFEASVKMPCSWVRPLTLFGSDSVGVKVPLLPYFARSPPLANPRDALRQSWPPMKKPEKSLIFFGFLVVMVFTVSLNSSRVFGTLTLAAV